MTPGVLVWSTHRCNDMPSLNVAPQLLQYNAVSWPGIGLPLWVLFPPEKVEAEMPNPGFPIPDLEVLGSHPRPQKTWSSDLRPSQQT